MSPRISKIKIVLILIFAAGSLVRLADIFRPIDKPSWRECDLGSISRNFVNEGFNPFYPQIDWRGTSPGYAEMEFTLYPALIAATYEIFGVHDFIGRVWALIFSLGTLFFFFKLARFYLDDTFAVFAALFFAFNPLVVEISTAIQPEGLMIFAYTAAVYFFVRWLENEKAKFFWAAIACTALALLAKATAVHIGLFFAVLLFQKYGFAAVKQRKVWLFGIISLLPAVLWYAHAKSLWKTYGNSLGVSNEYHWVGWDFFTNSYFIKGILRTELFEVWMIFGIVVGLFAVWRGAGEKTVKHVLLWLASIFLIYLAAARTTADDWASYYHIFSAPPAALLFGFGIKKLWEYAKELKTRFDEHSSLQIAFKAALILLITAAAVSAFLYEAEKIRAGLLERHLADKSFTCAGQIKPALKKEGLILASGGNCFDKDGYATAYNASFMFYWLERKGFSVCVEDQSLEKVRDFSAKGAIYFIAQRSRLKEAPGFEAALENNFAVVSECDEFLVFDIGGK
jgi:hypothetical protein